MTDSNYVKKTVSKFSVAGLLLVFLFFVFTSFRVNTAQFTVSPYYLLEPRLIISAVTLFISFSYFWAVNNASKITSKITYQKSANMLFALVLVSFTIAYFVVNKSLGLYGILIGYLILAITVAIDRMCAALLSIYDGDTIVVLLLAAFIPAITPIFGVSEPLQLGLQLVALGYLYVQQLFASRKK